MRFWQRGILWLTRELKKLNKSIIYCVWWRKNSSEKKKKTERIFLKEQFLLHESEK